MKIVHNKANDCFDCLTSGHQSVNSSRQAISMLSGKYKRFTFVYPVIVTTIILLCKDLLKGDQRFLRLQ